MTKEYFTLDASVAVVQAPASIAASGYSPGLDLKPYNDMLSVFLTSLNTAGALPTLAAKLQSAIASNLVGAITYAGTGNGRLTEVVGGPDAVAENITVTFSSATAFAVSGSVTGSMGAGVVGTKFSCPQISLIANVGATAFVNTDVFTVPMAARVYTDIPGAAFTGLTTGASIQAIGLEMDSIGRYLRAAYTIGGTVSPAYTVGVGMLAMLQGSP